MITYAMVIDTKTCIGWRGWQWIRALYKLFFHRCHGNCGGWDIGESRL